MDPVSLQRADALAVLRLDAGGLNVITPAVAEALGEALRDAESDASLQALVLLGREGAFSAGLDLKELARGGAAARELFRRFGEVLHGLYASRLRVVAGCTGHAVAAGAMLLLVSDVRIGARGDFRLGFSEVGRGLPLPELPVLLARDRLSRRFLQAATLLGQLYAPDAAAEVGFLDRTTSAEELEDEVLEAARGLAKLPADAYAEALRSVRRPTLERMQAVLEALR